jgi:predicted secreted hydrolase
MMKIVTFFIALFLTVSLNCILPNYSFAQDSWQTYPYSPPGSVLTFPADDGYHPDSSTHSEWWYINLHIVGSAPLYKKYDVMLVYFRFANMRIFNISDLSTKTFKSNVIILNPKFVTQLGKWDLTYTAAGINDYSHWTYPNDSIPYKYIFYAEDPKNNDMLDVTVKSLRPPLVVGGDGFIPLGNHGDSSYYYSYTNMTVEGKLRYNAIDDSITSGIAWIDRQWGPFTVGTNVNNKYEWFSLQVDKPGTILGSPQTPSEFNIWQIFSDSTSIPYKPEWRMVTSLLRDDSQDTSSSFIFERLSYWNDYVNNKYYSQSWRFIEPKHGVNINFSTNISNQVIDVTLFKFWEGGTTVKGTVNNQEVDGIGFAELVANRNTEIVPPEEPTGLAVKTFSNHFSLSWTASLAGTYPIGGYRIFRSTNHKGYWQYVASTTELSYDDYSASPDTAYYYTVTSFDNQTATSGSGYGEAVLTPPLSVNTINKETESLKIYPNPSNTSTIISFFLSHQEHAILKVFDLQGREITTLVDGELNPGEHTIVYDTNELPRGVYFCQLLSSGLIITQKMLISK